MFIVSDTRGGKTTLVTKLIEKLNQTSSYLAFVFHEYGSPVIPFLSNTIFTGPNIVLGSGEEREIAHQGHSDLNDAPVLASDLQLAGYFGQLAVDILGYKLEERTMSPGDRDSLPMRVLDLIKDGRCIATAPDSPEGIANLFVKHLKQPLLQHSMLVVDSLDTAVLPKDMLNPLGKEGYALGGLEASQIMNKHFIANKQTSGFAAFVATYYLPMSYWSRLNSGTQWFTYIRRPIESKFDFSVRDLGAGCTRIFGFVNPLSRSEIYEISLKYIEEDGLFMPDDFYTVLNQLASYPVSSKLFRRTLTLARSIGFQVYNSEALFNQIKLEDSCEQRGLTFEAAQALNDYNLARLEEMKLKIEKGTQPNVPTTTKGNLSVSQIVKMNEDFVAITERQRANDTLKKALDSAGIVGISTSDQLRARIAALDITIADYNSTLGAANTSVRALTTEKITKLTAERNLLRTIEDNIKAGNSGFAAIASGVPNERK